MSDILLAFLIHFYLLLFVYSIWIHRGYQHGLLVFHPAFDHFCRFTIWTVGWGTFPEWLRISSGTHRYHHRNSDTEEDPHSPWTISFTGLFINEKYNDFFNRHTHQELGNLAKDVPIFNDWIQKKLYNSNSKIPAGLIFSLFVYTVLFGWQGFISALIWLFLLKTFLMVFLAVWIIHKIGIYRHRQHKFPDKSINVFPIGIVLLGGELHSNHHFNPMSINDRARWFEFDLGYLIIKILEKCRLCKIRYHIVVSNKI